MGIFDSKRILFDTWNSWLSYAKKSVTWLLKAIFWVLYAIIIGIASIIYKLCVFLIGVIREWPLFSFVTITIVLSISMIVNYVSLTVKAKTYEHQRDSMGYELSVLKENYVPDSTLVIKDIDEQ